MDIIRYLSNELLVNLGPDFNDPKAVVREHKDANGNLQKIEVFYGGKYGGDSEGHGHWAAELIDGLFQVTIDRDPDGVDGGRHRIESNHYSDAYNNEARTERIAKKESIIAELRSLNPMCDNLSEITENLFNRFRDCGSCGHDDNVRLKQEFQDCRQQLFDRKNRICRDKKEDLIRQAESLSYSSDHKNAKDQIKSLLEQWKQSPRGYKQEEEYLWQQFKQASDRVYENARRDYEERKQKQDDAKRIKEDLIRQAESLSYSSDLRNAKEQIKQLQERWKQSPRASKEDEDTLWSRFRQASDRIYENAKRDHEERLRKQDDAKRIKEDLIRQAESLSYSSDLRNAKEQIKQLQERWKQSPRASKEDEDTLWSRFRQASNRIYENAKKDFEERKQKQALAKEIKEKLTSQAENLSYSTDFRSAKEQMKSLQEQWKQAPRASKEDEDALWSRFRQASDRLYANAKADAERRRQEYEQKRSQYTQHLQEVLYRKRESLDRLDNAIYRKEEQYSAQLMRPDPGYNNPHRYDIIERRNRILSNTESALTDMRIKRSQLVDAIANLESKIRNL